MRDQLSDPAREVLRTSRIVGNILYLPPAQLPRSLYMEVNDVLERLGGKWKGGRTKGHVFECDPSSNIAEIIETGMMPAKNPTSFFATPVPVVLDMLHSPQVPRIPQTAKRILEPSAGTGNIAVQVRLYCQVHGIDAQIECCESVPNYQERLRAQGFSVVADDFLRYSPRERYDAILMNPPFSLEGDALAYISHILHAYELLKDGGLLIAIAPLGFTFRSDRKSRAFLSLVEKWGHWEKLPDGSFKESGTGIATVLLHIVKPSLTGIVDSIIADSHTGIAVLEEVREMLESLPPAMSEPIEEQVAVLLKDVQQATLW